MNSFLVAIFCMCLISTDFKPSIAAHANLPSESDSSSSQNGRGSTHGVFPSFFQNKFHPVRIGPFITDTFFNKANEDRIFGNPSYGISDSGDGLVGNSPRAPPKESSIFDLFHKHLTNFHRRVPYPAFDAHFGIPTGPRKGHNDTMGGGHGGFRNFFKGVFSPKFNNTLTSLHPIDFGNLPPNYKNSTSRVDHTNGSKVVVNQTVHKKTGDDFHHFYHFKVVHVSPQDQSVVDEQIHSEVPEPDIPIEITEPSVVVDESMNEVDLDTRFPFDWSDSSFSHDLSDSTHLQSDSSLKAFDSFGKDYKLRRQVRRTFGGSGHLPSSNNRPIVFPPKDLNLKNYKFWDSASTNGRRQNIPLPPHHKIKPGVSYVYKDMDGNAYLYRITHVTDGNTIDNKDRNYEYDTVDNNGEAEIVGPIRPPDLSGDTRVNPDGSSSSQQGLTQVDPDAEVFDLSLVIKEMESRANDQ